MRTLTVLLAVCALIISVSCTAPSFCKCTCFTNSTIIELNPTTSDSTSPNLLHRRSPQLPGPIPNLSSLMGKIRGSPRPKPTSAIHARAPELPGPIPNIQELTGKIRGNPRPKPTTNAMHKRAPPPTCTRCNRAFCLAQNLPICKNAEEKDVQTSCFQRDSRKDQVVVLGFVAVTVGLLGWAAGREILERGRRRREGAYAPLNG